ncbi:MAG: hypothetical protein LBT89_11740 [Planctomycetaceae bacterium]|jgi:hypothetical protein|nr:hypothetical protein [Planctomycetaceae bacterium]
MLLSPKSDIVFKLIFGDQRNADVLAAFLQAVEIARYLLGIKIPISEIAAATNLSREEIEKLR